MSAIDVYVTAHDRTYGIAIIRSSHEWVAEDSDILGDLNRETEVTASYGHGVATRSFTSTATMTMFAQIMAPVEFNDYCLTVSIKSLICASIDGIPIPAHCPEPMAQVSREMCTSSYWYMNLADGVVYPTMMTRIWIPQYPKVEYLKDVNGLPYYAHDKDRWIGKYYTEDAMDIRPNLCVTARYGETCINNIWLYDADPPMHPVMACDRLIAEMRQYYWSHDHDAHAADIFALIILFCDEFLELCNAADAKK